MQNLWQRIAIGTLVLGGVAMAGYLWMPTRIADAAGVGQGRGYGMMNGNGRMYGRMNGGMMAMRPAMLDLHNQERAAVAAVLGMTADDLAQALNAGRKVEDLANEKRVEISKIAEAQATARQSALDALVAAGTLTRAQADLMLQHMAQVGTATLYGGTMMQGVGCPMAQPPANGN